MNDFLSHPPPITAQMPESRLEVRRLLNFAGLGAHLQESRLELC